MVIFDLKKESSEEHLEELHHGGVSNDMEKIFGNFILVSRPWFFLLISALYDVNNILFERCVS